MRGQQLAEHLERDIGRIIVYDGPTDTHRATVVGVVHDHGGYYHYVVEWDVVPPHWFDDGINPAAAAWADGTLRWKD